MYNPNPATLPLPIEYLDIQRKAFTNSPAPAEGALTDLWLDRTARLFADYWTGKGGLCSSFVCQNLPQDIIGAVDDTPRSAPIQENHSTSGPNTGKNMTPVQKQEAIDSWAVEGPKHEACREKRCIPEQIPKDELDTTYTTLLKQAMEDHKPLPVTAMPIQLTGKGTNNSLT